jgi:FkbM family methyltransferase
MIPGNMLKRVAVGTLWALMGRKNLVRFARLLTNESRFDTANEMATNGELLIHDHILKNIDSSRSTIALDIGANIGEWTHRILTRAMATQKNIKIHAFEPCKATYNTFVNNLEKWQIQSNVIANSFALSSAVGERDFYTIGANAGRNSLHAIDGDQQHVEKIRVSTLDEYCRNVGISDVALLKIDTEGHDLEVIYGATELLESGKIECVQFEYNHRWIAARHFLRDAFMFLNPKGYEIGKITPQGIEFYPHWHPELESFREGNYLAVKSANTAKFPQVPWWNC